MDTYPAFQCARPVDTPLFFYHLPKTGGTTVDAALHGLAHHRRRPFTIIPRAVGMRERPVPAALLADADSLAYGGHCWFGLHRSLAVPVNTCTVLREPVGRVVSEYLWRAGTAGVAPSAAGFEHYLDNIAMGNTATRLLAGQSEIDWQSLGRAIANLESCFLVGSTEDLAGFITTVLTLYGGPSIRTGRAKESRDPLKETLVARYRDAIAARNVYDAALYAHAERHLFGRVGVLRQGFVEPSPHTVTVTNPDAKNFRITDAG